MNETLTEGTAAAAGTDVPDLRERAMVRLRKRRELAANVLAYVMVNAFLVVIWAVTGAGYFWPVFPMAGWLIGLVFHGWDTFGSEPSEERIRREMERLGR